MSSMLVTRRKVLCITYLRKCLSLIDKSTKGYRPVKIEISDKNTYVEVKTSDRDGNILSYAVDSEDITILDGSKLITDIENHKNYMRLTLHALLKNDLLISVNSICATINKNADNVGYVETSINGEIDINIEDINWY